MEKVKEIRIDDFTENLVKDPDNPPNLIVLSGFVGRSTRKGYVRLYLTPELNDYIEIPEEKIHHQEQVQKVQNSLGGSQLWIERETTIVRKKVESRTMQADFLQGEITQENLAKVNAGMTVEGLEYEEPVHVNTHITCAITCHARTCFYSCYVSCARTLCINTCIRTICNITCRCY
jgi:hypothetical protein